MVQASKFACDLCQRPLDDFYWLDSDEGVYCVCFDCFVDNMLDDDTVSDVQADGDGDSE